MVSGTSLASPGSGSCLLDAEDVNDEDEIALGFPLSSRAVGKVLRDDQKNAGADRLAFQALGPALDDTGKREACCLASVKARIELLAAHKIDAYVVHRESVSGLNSSAGALDEVLCDEFLRSGCAVNGDLREALVIFLHGGEPSRRSDGLAFRLRQDRSCFLSGKQLENHQLRRAGCGARSGRTRRGERYVGTHLGANNRVVDQLVALLELVIQLNGLGAVLVDVFNCLAVIAIHCDVCELGNLAGLDTLAVAFADYLDGWFSDGK